MWPWLQIMSLVVEVQFDASWPRKVGISWKKSLFSCSLEITVFKNFLFSNYFIFTYKMLLYFQIPIVRLAHCLSAEAGEGGETEDHAVTYGHNSGGWWTGDMQDFNVHYEF